MISTIIATKNGEKYIRRAIQSALDQSIAADPTMYPGFEIIVISDASSDNTANIVREMIAADAGILNNDTRSTIATIENQPRIKLIELNINVGPGAARAKAISESNPANKYIAILDDDDEWINPKKLENQIAFLEHNPSVAAVGATKTEFATENGKRLFWYTNSSNPKTLHKNMLMRCPLVHSSTVFRKDIYEKVGGYTEMRLAEDYDLWLRMGQIADIANISDAETRYTARTNSTSGSNGKSRITLTLVVIGLVKKYGKCYPRYYTALLKGYLRIGWKWIFKI